jgi:hypothetical protein
MSTEFVTLREVEVLEATDSELLCRIGARNVWVPLAQVGIADRAVRKAGDRGPLVISLRLTRELRLQEQ